MTNKTYNYATFIETTTNVSIYENVLNEHLITFSRKDFMAISNKTFKNLLCFISDLEEFTYRLNKLIKDLMSSKIGFIKFEIKRYELFSEIDSRFNHYFVAQDMPLVISIIEQIARTTRIDDSAYSYFCNNSLRLMENKTKQQMYFDDIKNLKTFDESLNNYIASNAS